MADCERQLWDLVRRIEPWSNAEGGRSSESELSAPVTQFWQDGRADRDQNARVPDAANLSGNVIDGISNERRIRFIEHALRSRGKMEASIEAKSLQAGCRRIAEALKM